MSAGGNQLVEAGGAPSLSAILGAVVCAGVGVLLAAAAAVVTFGLSRSYGFGPGWAWSAFLMTGAVAALVGAALLSGIRLARLRFRALPVLVSSAAAVFAICYVAGLIGNGLHH